MNEEKPVCINCAYFVKGQCNYPYECSYSLEWDSVSEQWVPVEIIYWR